MTERELKLEAPPHFDPPDLSGVEDGIAASGPVEKRTTTTYWDTADLRMARWGCSLRHRSGEGWTVKLAPRMDGDMMVREERAFRGPSTQPPRAALDLVLAFARSAELQPVATLRTRRRAISLVDGAGKEQAEVVDDEVSVLDGRRIAVRFRQIEVETRAPHANGMVADVVARLRAAGAPDPVPKHVRAMGPRSQAPPEVSPPKLDKDSIAADVIRYAIATPVVRLLRSDALVRIGGDVESTHQARVATRRLRSDLRTFAPIVDAEWADSLREELRWLGELLGELRDADILTERLATQLREISSSGGDGRRISRRLAGRRRRARDHLLKAMRSQRYVDLLDRLVAAAQEPSLSPAAEAKAADVLPPLARRPWRQLAATVRKLGKIPTNEQLHAVRIDAKRCRYAAEALAPVMGKQARRFAETVAELQQTLGDYNDSILANEWLHSAAVEMQASTAFIAGALSEKERGTAQKMKAAWPSVWKKLSRPKLHQWMET